jgi:hypothetical protein
VEKIFDNRGNLLAAKKMNLLLGDSGANIDNKVFKNRNYDTTMRSADFKVSRWASRMVFLVHWMNVNSRPANIPCPRARVKLRYTFEDPNNKLDIFQRTRIFEILK